MAFWLVPAPYAIVVCLAFRWMSPVYPPSQGMRDTQGK